MLSAKQEVFNEKVNELTSMEFKYQASSASSTNKILMLAEFQLKQNEVNNIQKTLLNNR